MSYGLYIHFNTKLKENAKYIKYDTMYETPIELCDITGIGIGYVNLVPGSDEPKVKIIENENEELLLREFYEFFIKLIKKCANEREPLFLIGYDIRKYIYPSILKKLINKYKITTYDELPPYVKFKDLKPWESGHLIDLKEESAIGGYTCNYDIFKFEHDPNLKSDDLMSDILFLIKMSNIS